jgi:HAD superfamily hydrolase (TIGR01549 family)
MGQAKEKIKAVIFDFGETLVSFGEVNTAALFKEGSKLTFDFLKSCGVHLKHFRLYSLHCLYSIRLQYFLSHITGKDFDSMALLKKIGARHNFKLTEEQWKELVWLWYKPLKDMGDVEPDLAETVSKLKNMGLKLGVLSNTFVHGSSLERHLAELDALDYFDVKMYSYQFDFRKPDPRIFVEAADRIGERLKNILYVGDRTDKDIKPTLQLDMHAALRNAFTNKNKKTPKGAWRIDKLSELPALIEKANA